MKETAILLSITLLVACGGKESGSSQLHMLLSKKDSLISVYSEVGSQLSDVQAQIDQLDTSSVKRITLVKDTALHIGLVEHYF